LALWLASQDWLDFRLTRTKKSEH